MQAGGDPHGGAVGHEGTGVGVAVGTGVGVGVPLGSGVPVGVGSGVGVSVGVGVGVGATVDDGDGVAVTESGSQTDSMGLMFESEGTVVTLGSSNVGIPSPP